jgi:hypothetical protein
MLKSNTLGKIINPPNKNRVPAKCIGTLSNIDKIIQVANWFSLKGWNVVFKKDCDCEISPQTKSVFLNNKLSKHTLLHIMLHEAGHLRLLSSKDYFDEYAEGYVRIDRDLSPRPFKHRVEVLREEFDAWKEGEKLASELKINLDRKDYRAERDRSLKTYIEWVSNPKKYMKTS